MEALVPSGRCAAVPTVNLARYQGKLQPWVREMVRLHERGWAAQQIADQIAVRLRQSGVDDYVSHSMVRYVLRRVGVLAPAASAVYGAQQAKRRARNHAVIERWLDDADSSPDWATMLRVTGLSKGRPLDMGGPRDEWLERGPWDER